MNTFARLLLVLACAPAVPAQLYRTPVYPTSDSPFNFILHDMDGDGHVDVVVADAVNGNLKILAGDGSGTLTTVATLAPGNHPIGLSAGDVNGDGLVDVIASLWQADRLSVNKALGGWVFAAPVKPVAPDGPRDVQLADLDGDGDLDAITANAGVTLTTVLKNTAGTLTKVATYGPPPPYLGGEDVTAADLDLDGDLDAVLSVTSFGEVAWLPNDGTGTLGSTVVLQAGISGQMVVVADLNEDGWPDLASSAENFGGGLPIWYGLGGGVFDDVHYAEVLGVAPSVVAGDANGDGHADLVLGGTEGDGLVLLGDGTGAFAPKKPFHVGPSWALVRLADMDEDGLQDAVGIGTSVGVTVRLGDGFGAYPEPRHVAVTSGSSVLSVPDLDGDGLVDMVTGGSFVVGVQHNLGAALFEEVATVPAGSQPEALDCADLDGDGDSDLMLGLYSDGTVAVRMGNGLGFGSATVIDVTGYPVGIAAADMGVGAAGKDIAVASYGLGFDGLITVIPNDGAGGWLTPADHAAGKLPNAPKLLDVDADGDRDILYVQGGIPSYLSLLRNAGGSFGAPETWLVGTGAEQALDLAVGDVDEDGDLDALTSNQQDDSVTLFLASGGGFGAGTTYALPANYPGSVELVDLDGDGHVDAAVASDEDVLCVLPGDGSGVLGTASAWVSGRNPDVIKSADFDADGGLDVATGEHQPSVALLLTDSVTPWTNLAHGLAGDVGTPQLEPDGSLEAGSTVTLPLTNAKPSSVCALFLGLSAINAPFKGGTLVPSVDVLITGLPTGSGSLPLAGTLPAGLPAGVTLHAQYWVVDAAGPKGFAASNAVVGLTP